MTPSSDVNDRKALLLRRVAIAAGLLLSVSFALVFPWPTEGRLWGEIFDLAHAPVFCGVLLLIVGLCDPPAVGISEKHPVLFAMTPGRITLLVVMLVGFGAVAEVLQKLVGRSASFGDIAANSVGLLVGLCWIGRCRRRGQRGRVLILTALGLLAAVSVSPLLDAWDCVQQIRSFPVLASFERPREFRNWRAHRADLSRSDEWATDGHFCAKLELRPEQYPGMLMTWFERDWSGQQAFLVDFRNPGTVDLEIIIKLHDEKHAQDGFQDDDRYHESVVIPAGQEVAVRIPLDEVRNAPARRTMNLNRMWTIDFFAIQLAQPAILLVDAVRLE